MRNKTRHPRSQTHQLKKMGSLSCIDLFCGCGGFSLGFKRAGFNVVAAVDFKPEAVEVLRKNIPSIPHVLERDLTKFGPEKLAELINTDRVDVIIGGPPCQGFSTSRQRDGANSGPRMVDDPRRHLYREFLKYVRFFKPTVFVIENVLGIKSAAGGEYFTRVQKEARAAGYRVHPKVERAVELGVPQKRVRQLIIGTRIDCPAYFPVEVSPAPRANVGVSLGEAIMDLPPLKAGEGEEIAEYDIERRREHISRYGDNYLKNVLEVGRASRLTAHKARYHSDRDLRDFHKLREGENSAQAMKRGEVFEFPYKKTSFKDRYTRQQRKGPCSTIVAHLSKDGLMFIHPTQNRSLTVREAARVQSFPDWFEFSVPRTEQYRMIGNAVPPLIAEAVAHTVVKYISSLGEYEIAEVPDHIPNNPEFVRPILDLFYSGPKDIKKLSNDQFLRVWHSILAQFPSLHPAAAEDHGDEESRSTSDRPYLPQTTIELQIPYYTRSGWPVILAPLATEALRRHASGVITTKELYSDDALARGLSELSIHSMRNQRRRAVNV